MKVFVYASSSYAARAHVLIESISRHSPEAGVIFCSLDSDAATGLKSSSVSSIFHFEEFLQGQNLPSISEGKSFSEILFTHTPGLIRHALSFCDEGEDLIYLDSDTCVYTNLQKIRSSSSRQSSVILFEHAFSNFREKFENRYGKFNAGAVLVRNDPTGRRFLERWADLSHEWCFDRVEDGKYAHQKYLDDLATEFHVESSDLRGANLAPWNSKGVYLRRKDDVFVLVFGRKPKHEPLIFFHFHGLRDTNRGWLLGHLPYLSLASSSLKRELYSDYISRLESAACDLDFLNAAPRDSGKLGKNLVNRLYQTACVLAKQRIGSSP